MKLAVIGATGLVGRMLLGIIEEDAPVLGSLGLYASKQSAGVKLSFHYSEHVVAPLEECQFADYDAVLFCVGDELSAEYVPRALSAGCAVVDKSNAYRLDPRVPLVVPGINDAAVSAATRLVANPNCTTIVLMHALAPLARRFGLQRMFVATYQSVSGAGKPGVAKLQDEYKAMSSSGKGMGELVPSDAGHIAFNVQARIGALDEYGRAGEETKLIEESRKILGRSELLIACHAVRVPVFVGHAIAVSVELREPATSAELEVAWADCANVKYMDDELPTPVGSARHDRVEVGRLRSEPALKHGWSFFVCGDNLNIGAALNGWRILKLLATAGAVPELTMEKVQHDG